MLIIAENSDPCSFTERRRGKEQREDRKREKVCPRPERKEGRDDFFWKEVEGGGWDLVRFGLDWVQFKFSWGLIWIEFGFGLGSIWGSDWVRFGFNFWVQSMFGNVREEEEREGKNSLIMLFFGKTCAAIFR